VTKENAKLKFPACATFNGNDV